MPVVKEPELFVAAGSVGDTDSLPMQRTPIDPDGSGARRPPPALAEHTAEVLREVGYEDAAVAGIDRADPLSGEKNCRAKRTTC